MVIENGYYIKARKIQDSEIAHAPPHVREIWDYFLREANHQEVKKYGKTIQRGQLIRTYGDIIEALHWMVGWRKMSYSKSDCETAMKWLKKRAMVLTEKTTRGMVVTVCNYDTYQDPKHYENHKDVCSKPTREPQTDDTINKNGRIKELKKGIIPKKKHPFSNSPYYDFNVFKEPLLKKGWSIEKIKVYYEKAEGYSKANGGRYLDWLAAIQNWERSETKTQTPTKPLIVMDKIYR